MSQGMFILHIAVSFTIVLTYVATVYVSIVYPKYRERAPSQGR